MKKILGFLVFAALVFVLSFSIQDAHAATFRATQSGNWNDPATWGGSSPPITILPGDQVGIGPGITVSINLPVSNSGTITNSGTIANSNTITNSGTIANFGGTITNFGTITSSGIIGNVFGGIIDNFHIITNSGTISHQGGAITNEPSSTITNSGTINSAGTITNLSTITNSGTISSATILKNLGTITNMVGGSIQSGGTFNNTGGGIIRNSGSIGNLFGGIMIVDNILTNYITGTITNFGTIINGIPGRTNGEITNSGTITNEGPGTITNKIQGDITNSGTIITKPASVINNDNIIRNSGTINTSGTIINNKSGRIDNTLPGEINNTGPIINSGTINNYRLSTINNNSNDLGLGSIDNLGTIYNQCFAIFNNFGILTGNPLVDPCATAHVPIANGNWNDPTIWKQGTVPGPSDDVIIPFGFDVTIPTGVSVSNSRTITLDNGGILINSGSLTNTGIITVTETSKLINYGTISNTGTINNDLGTIINSLLVSTGATGTILNSGAINNNGEFDSTGIMTNNSDGTFTNTGTFSVTFGTFTNSGTFNNAIGTNTEVGGFLIANHSGDFINTGTITNDGTFTNLSPFTKNSGSITNNKKGTIENGNADNSATLTNSGTITNSGVFINLANITDILGGTFINTPGGFLYSTSLISNLSSHTIDNSGTIFNSGDIANTGDVTNNSGGIINNIGSIDTTGGTFSNLGIINNFAGSTITGQITGNQPNLINDHAPVANSATLSTTKNNPVLITLSASDLDNDLLTYSIIPNTGPFHGTLSPLSGNQVTYTPNTDFAGQDSFQFKVNDGTVDSNIASVTITVFASTPTPTITTTSSSQNPSTFGQPVTFTATVSPTSATGDVTFTIDGISQPPVALSAGQASLAPLSTLTVGAHTITSSYGGDATFDISTSPPLSQTVNQGSLQVTGATISPTEGMSFSGMVAQFTDSDPNGIAGDFTATINWGDGTTTNGIISPNSNGGFDLSGTHTYAEEGSNPLSVMISDVDGTSATGSGMANVADAPLTANPTNINAVAGIAFTGMVAHFTDSDPNGIAGDFTATIDWGDGVTTNGIISANSNGGFDLTGTHTYGSSGSDTVSITTNDAGGATASATGTATVSGQGTTPQKVTGKGHLDDENFEFDVGTDGKTFAGHLEYHDKKAHVDLDSTKISFVDVDSSLTHATFRGEAKVNDNHNVKNSSGTNFLVSVVDKDKTGNHDTFSISLIDSTGKVIYKNSGKVKGHIEIH